MTVRGVEAIDMNLSEADGKIDLKVTEEKFNQAKQEANNKQNNKTMTSVERYRQEWSKLLKDLDENYEVLRDLAFSGHLNVSKFRSIYWALLLRVLNADYRTWHEQRSKQRNRYEHLKHEFGKNPHDIERPDDNPLSQSKQSVWNQYFSDQELFAVIKQDVIRTFPSVDFFRKEIIQTAMSNILFYYAREHPYMCYRQGMHELLAPILFVLYSDHQSLLHFKELAVTENDNVLLDVINPQYLEADSFSIFARLMAIIESYYRITHFTQTPTGFIPVEADSPDITSTEVEVISQLNSIRDKILAKEDLHLHNYLLKLDIPLHIFGIRWLRLLFGREFALLDLLVLWDAIFADSDHFDLPKYILVAMLIRIRDKLLMNDYTTCLTFLMRYPANVDVNLILRHALHMQMPKRFERPPNAFIYFTMNQSGVQSGGLVNNSVGSTSVAQRKKVQATISKPLATDLFNRQQRTRSISLGSTNTAQMEKQILALQSRNAANSAVSERMRATPESNHVVMDGYLENSPELLRLELQNAQTIITIARNKLQKYLHVIRGKVSITNNNSNDFAELAQALDGIEEICNFLDVKFVFPSHSRPTPIDSAIEANEIQSQRQIISKSKTLNKTNATNGRYLDTQINSEISLITSRSDDIGESEISDSKIDEECLKNTIGLPPSLANDKILSNTVCTVYERPDNGFMLTSHRILGNRKEIELIPIATDEQIETPKICDSGNKGNQQKTPTQLRTTGFPLINPINVKRHENS